MCFHMKHMGHVSTRPCTAHNLFICIVHVLGTNSLGLHQMLNTNICTGGSVPAFIPQWAGSCPPLKAFIGIWFKQNVLQTEITQCKVIYGGYLLGCMSLGLECIAAGHRGDHRVFSLGTQDLNDLKSTFQVEGKFAEWPLHLPWEICELSSISDISTSKQPLLEYLL